ncbi:hypothetical protein C8Q76DRAFT_796479 [Earliella scabrosa]|nr:hypothetical protein C8Q76DRAFT_796479 [Earliella scabrosa]
MTSPNVLIQQVISPSQELVEDVIALMTDLMRDDPAFLAMSGNDESVRPLITRTWVIDGIAIGDLWTATEGDDLVGFMLFLPPGAAAKISKEERAKINQPLLDALSKEGLEYYMKTYYQDFPVFVSQCLAPVSLGDVWWLRSAMIRPDRQRQGIARALLEPMRRKAAELGQCIACSTTTFRNVAVYKGLGFEERGTREMPSPWNTWSLFVFLMKP